MKKLKEISGKKFIEEILNGKTYFIDVEIEPNFSLSLLDHFNQEEYRELHRFLSKLKSDDNGLCIMDSRAIGLDISGLDLSDFAGNGTNFQGANFSYSNLYGAHFYNADLRKVNFEKAILRCAEFNGADLRGSKNLEKAIGLETVKCEKTIVTPEEERIIRKYLFDVRKH